MAFENALWALKRINEDLLNHKPFAVDDEWWYHHKMLIAITEALIDTDYSEKE